MTPAPDSSGPVEAGKPTVRTDASDDTLNRLVAEHVASWRPVEGINLDFSGVRFPVANRPPSYATSADAMLPLLERESSVSLVYRGLSLDWCASVSGHTVCNESPARAACLALLAAHGFSVEG